MMVMVTVMQMVAMMLMIWEGAGNNGHKCHTAAPIFLRGSVDNRVYRAPWH